MKTVILSDAAQKNILLKEVPAPDAFIWVEDLQQFSQHRDAEAFIDLLFEPMPERIRLLQQLLPAVVIINSVTETLSETDPSFVRVNGWNSFLAGPLMEAAADPVRQQQATSVLSRLGKTPEWLPDEPGFVTPRVISMIINEAYLSLQEGVSTKEDINTAMRLGTNYPFGPFEWAEQIGLSSVRALLEKLSRQQPRYTPAALLHA